MCHTDGSLSLGPLPALLVALLISVAAAAALLGWIIGRSAAQGAEARGERKPAPRSPRARLRKRLDRILLGDSDLDAFCLDYFPDVKRRFTSSMDRVAKVNLLLERVDARMIEMRLYKAARLARSAGASLPPKNHET